MAVQSTPYTSIARGNGMGGAMGKGRIDKHLIIENKLTILLCATQSETTNWCCRWRWLYFVGNGIREKIKSRIYLNWLIFPRHKSHADKWYCISNSNSSAPSTPRAQIPWRIKLIWFFFFCRYAGQFEVNANISLAGVANSLAKIVHEFMTHVAAYNEAICIQRWTTFNYKMVEMCTDRSKKTAPFRFIYKFALK